MSLIEDSIEYSESKGGAAASSTPRYPSDNTIYPRYEKAKAYYSCDICCSKIPYQGRGRPPTTCSKECENIRRRLVMAAQRVCNPDSIKAAKKRYAKRVEEGTVGTKPDYVPARSRPWLKPASEDMLMSGMSLRALLVAKEDQVKVLEEQLASLKEDLAKITDETSMEATKLQMEAAEVVAAVLDIGIEVMNIKLKLKLDSADGAL